MPDKNASDNPPRDSNEETRSQSPTTPTTPKQNEMGKPSDNGTKEALQQTAQLERDIKTGEKWLIVLQIITIIANIVIAKIYYGQLQEMRKATVAAQGAVTEAQQSRLQAVNAFNATIEQFHLDQRPWIGIRNIHIDPLEKDKEVVVTVTLVNSGKTLANNVNVDGYSTLAFSEKSKLDHFPEPTKEQTKSVGIFWPNLDSIVFASGIASNQHTFSFPQGSIDNISQRKLFLFVYGAYTYKDIFKTRHSMTYCARYSPVSKKFETCANYNHAD